MKPPPPQDSQSPATFADVCLGMDKLCRDIGSLQGEVNALTNLLGQFTKGRQLRKFDWTAEMEIDRLNGERSSTPEPKSNIQEALYLLQKANTIEELTLMLKAVSRDLEGALQDVRATRIRIKDMDDDTGTREEFRQWLDRRP